MTTDFVLVRLFLLSEASMNSFEGKLLFPSAMLFCKYRILFLQPVNNSFIHYFDFRNSNVFKIAKDMRKRE